jgi:hypothetical protein
MLTCPPLNPTATTPRSWRFGRNLGCNEGADVIVAKMRSEGYEVS